MAKTALCIAKSYADALSNKKALLSQRRTCDAPNIWMPWKVPRVLANAPGYFSRNLYRAIVPIDTKIVLLHAARITGMCYKYKKFSGKVSWKYCFIVTLFYGYAVIARPLTAQLVRSDGSRYHGTAACCAQPLHRQTTATAAAADTAVYIGITTSRSSTVTSAISFSSWAINH